MAKLTTEEKIAFYKAQIIKLELQVASDLARNDVQTGDNVSFKFGRGDTRKVLTGTVLGVKDEANGRWVAIGAGEGFDYATYKVRATDLAGNTTADTRRAAGSGPLNQA